MIQNKNIFCASNPARLTDALLSFNLVPEDIVFLPSRRAIRTLEKKLSENGASLLPQLVALGEADDDNAVEDIISADTVSNLERTIVLSKLFSVMMNTGVSQALPVAKDFIRMSDYMENEGVSLADSLALIDLEYAGHHLEKAAFFKEALQHLPAIFPSRQTQSQKRNSDIRGWIKTLPVDSRVFVCGSTASVPATSDLMNHVANMPNGFIILPGKVNGFITNDSVCNPYYSIDKFLKRIGIDGAQVGVIDTGESNIDFLNNAFDNTDNRVDTKNTLYRIDAARESEEAAAAAEIAARAIANNKSVLIITPDAAGNQRLAQAFTARGLSADFSGGISATQSLFGRRVLNAIDALRFNEIDDLFTVIDNLGIPCSEDDFKAIESIKSVSDILQDHKITLARSDVRSIVEYALSVVQIRPAMADDCAISVLGTIESRMQSADVIILTGLNEGMFPANGYENPWLPRRVADSAGLPSPMRKISLMALDFINLSCYGEVYWLRSRVSGGTETTESRFLSRIAAAGGNFTATDILQSVRSADAVPLNLLDYSAPTPPANRDPVFVTSLELLTHNPYAFYARHILRLRPINDPWNPPGAREFGNMIHDAVMETDISEKALVEKLDADAKELLKKSDISPNGILFQFWHKRFLEIAPAVINMLKNTMGGYTEIPGEITIDGRIVRARADRVWPGGVLDIKTGTVPSAKQMEEGNMPQLPLEALMLQQGKFAGIQKNPTPSIQFLQLKANNVRLIEYTGATAQKMIDGTVQKMSGLFGQYGKDGAAYEYRETNGNKYKAYDDLARFRDQ